MQSFGEFTIVLGINVGDDHQLVKVRVQHFSPLCDHLVPFRRDGHETLASMLWALCRLGIAVLGKFDKHCTDGRIAVPQGDGQLMLGDRAAMLQNGQKEKTPVGDAY